MFVALTAAWQVSPWGIAESGEKAMLRECRDKKMLRFPQLKDAVIEAVAFGIITHFMPVF